MVSIPSVTGDEAGIQRFLADYMNGMGLTVDQWETDWEQLKKHPGYRPVDRGYEGRPNIVATWKGSGGGRSLLLNGHSDVIPVGNGEGWSDNPWSGAIKDGRIYGRGAADMKSGVASHIMAVASLTALGVKPKGDVYINIVIDEEVSGHGTLDTVIRGYKADAGISGEPAISRSSRPASPHLVRDRDQRQGRGIQRRYEGVSGIELGYKIANAVAALEAERVATVKHPLYPSAIDAIPCAIGSFQAGNYPSAFPATCLLKGSIATSRERTMKASSGGWSIGSPARAAEDPWMKLHPPKVRFVGYDAQASEIPRGHPITETVSKAYREVTGRDPGISGRQGAADTRFLNQYRQHADRDLRSRIDRHHAFRRRVCGDRRLHHRHQSDGSQHLRLVRNPDGLADETARPQADRRSDAASLVVLERSGRIATIRLNNPPVNAASLALLEALHRTLDDIEADTAIRCVILTSTGRRRSAPAPICATKPGCAIRRRALRSRPGPPDPAPHRFLPETDRGSDPRLLHRRRHCDRLGLRHKDRRRQHRVPCRRCLSRHHPKLGDGTSPPAATAGTVAAVDILVLGGDFGAQRAWTRAWSPRSCHAPH